MKNPLRSLLALSLVALAWTSHRPPAAAAVGPAPTAAPPIGLTAGAAVAGAPARTHAEPRPGSVQDAADDPDVVVDPALLETMEYRLIGPYRGGRVTAVTGVVDDPYTFYFGGVGGGVWKTTSAGTEWTNVSDGFFEVGSIGAVEVAPADPNVVFVGTGSACPRGNVSVGNGVYRSTDAGRTWSWAGLPEAGQIGRIRVHPRDPDLVYVAALGHIFGPNEERGVYRSRDGGETWERVLHVSREVGAVDLSMNPVNPREIYAAMWRAERKPWTMIDGGDGSGLYKTTDGGDTWTELTDTDNGLPGGLLGRIGVSVSPADPDRVWALITADGDDGGLYRSDDAGESWTMVSDDRDLLTRGWYYSHVTADPADADTVWVNNGGFYRSVDGGRDFSRVSTPHGDNHDLWINPRDPEIMIQANDGGANVSLDGAETWSTQLNQPTAEFYRVTVDNRFPYRVYGAQQDNSTISVPAWSSGALTPYQNWYGVAGGESGHIAVHPENPDLVYAGNYIGRIDRFDRTSGHARNVIIYPEMQDGTAPRELRHRFQWNAPIRISPHDPDLLYHTSNFVHRSRDGGMSWETISPDLTRDEPEKQELPGGPIQHDHTGVEVFNTIFAFEESPHTAGVLWAGSDDGLVHLSRDAGATWEEITPPGMEPDSTVNTIALSPHEPGRAFLAVHRYRMDDFRPLIWRTDDHGASWTLLTDGTNGIPADHPVRAIAEDPDRRGLLYAGTEFGIFVSFDDGAHWQSLQLDLPVVPITDLTVHRQDLVVATQGRSFWILDDLTPLHEVQDVVLDQPHLFAPRDAHRVDKGGFRAGAGPEAPAEGAVIHYWLPERPDDGATGELRLDILDAAGEVVRSFEGGDSDESEETPSFRRTGADDPKAPMEEGMNRFVWDLKREGPELVDGALFSLAYTGGYHVVPGRFSVRLVVDDWSRTRGFEVLADPRLTAVSRADLEAQSELLGEIAAELERIHGDVETLRSVREQLRSVAGRVEEAGFEGNWTERAEEIADGLTAVEEELIQTDAEAGQDLLNFPPRLDDQFAYLYSHVYGAYGRPTEGSYERLDDLRERVRPHLEALQTILDEDVGRFNADLDAAGVPRIIIGG